MLGRVQPRSLRASSGSDLKTERGVASCGGGSQPFAPGGPGPRPPGTTTWLRGARCTDPGNAGDGSAAPGEKPPRWSAERRASRVTGRKAPRKRLAYRVISAFTRVCDAHDTPHGCLARTRTFLGAPPTPRFGVSEATMQNPDANASRERDGLFDIVSYEPSPCAMLVPHPEERACRGGPATSIARARVSKDEDGHGAGSSCFETHRSALGLWKRLRSRPAAMLLSMRATVRGAFWPNEAKRAYVFDPSEASTCGCGKRSPAALHCSGLLFTMNAATPTCRAVSARSADRKSTRLNSSHPSISYAVFCLKKKKSSEACLARKPKSYVSQV